MPLAQGTDSGERGICGNEMGEASLQSSYADPGIVADSPSLCDQVAKSKQELVTNGEHTSLQSETLPAYPSIQQPSQIQQPAQGPLGTDEVVNGEVIADCPPGFAPLPSLQLAEPRMPVGWRAIWQSDDQRYYFWHVPTNFTTYEAPQVREVISHASQDAKYMAEEEARQRHRSKQILHVMNMTNCSKEQAQELLEKYRNLEAAVRAYSAEKEKEQQAQSPSGKAQTAMGPSGSYANALQGLKKAWGKGKHTAAPKLGLSPTSAWSKGPGSAASSASAPAATAPTVEVGKEYVCSQHWQPQPNHDGCIGVHHGDRFLVTWTDNFAGGWAYGAAIDDKSKKGYIPQTVLVAPQRPISAIAAGEHRKVLEAFEAPQDMGGFVSLHPGDEVTIIHAGSHPCVWVYADVMRVSEAGEFKSERGWAPEMVLSPKSI